MVDSGADRSLFPLAIGELFLKIDFKKIRPVTIMGIGSSAVKAYPTKFNIWVNNLKFAAEADFCIEQQVPLLGRQGFFSLFKQITFQEDNKFTVIETLD